MGNLYEEMIMNIKSSTCEEEEEFTKIRLLPVSLRNLNLKKKNDCLL